MNKNCGINICENCLTNDSDACEKIFFKILSEYKKDM